MTKTVFHQQWIATEKLIAVTNQGRTADSRPRTSRSSHLT